MAATAPSRAFGQTRSRFAPKFDVIPVEVDNGSFVVASFWRYGLGCLLAPPAGDGFGCPNQSESDQRNEGLLLLKSNQTAFQGKATAQIKGVKGAFLFELGYDLRKASSIELSDQGSECNDNAPRFEIQMADNSNYYIPCQLPSDDQSTSLYWRRPRWGGASPLVACIGQGSPTAVCTTTEIGCADANGCGPDKRVVSLRLVMDVGGDDEQTDGFTAEQSGLSVLDNIDVNARLKGSAPAPRRGDEDEGQGRDKDGREFHFADSPSAPASSTFDFTDPGAGMSLVGANGVRGIAYSLGALGQPCVSFSGDALVNGKAGYLYTFASCDLSAVGLDLGTYNITVTGPIGTLPYSKTAALTMGYVAIHK
jgi:hypothetical protein